MPTTFSPTLHLREGNEALQPSFEQRLGCHTPRQDRVAGGLSHPCLLLLSGRLLLMLPPSHHHALPAPQSPCSPLRLLHLMAADRDRGAEQPW